jgi:hypothetical protein
MSSERQATLDNPKPNGIGVTALRENGDRVEDLWMRIVGESTDDLHSGICRCIRRKHDRGRRITATAILTANGFSTLATFFSTLCQTPSWIRLALPYRPAG